MRIAKSQWAFAFSLLTFASTLSLCRRLLPLVCTIIMPFDDNWQFSGIVNADLQAQSPAFADAAWRTLNLPHDWSIEGQIDPANRSGAAGAFLPAGIGWYRKHFTLPPTPPTTTADKRVFIEFDGVMQDSTVWINGKEAGHRPYGYATFRYDITDNLNPTGDNVLAVRADNSVQPASRWYSGSGIDRHVRLIVTSAIHLEQWATFITTPQITPAAATIHIATSILNQSQATKDVSLQIDLLDPTGKSVSTLNISGKQIEAGKTAPFSADITIPNPQLWSIDSPQLYHAVVRVKTGKDTAAIDDETIPLGIRTFEFKPETGFWLNGKNLKIYGVCLHNDGGGIGAAVPMGIWERRLLALKAVGVNAVRTSHNAPDPEFLNLCDRLGIMVMHEVFDVWTARKVPGDYARFFNDWYERDLTDAVMRDRNHPSIILYSAGNEIHDSQDKQKEILPKLIAIYKKVDPTRPVTQALFRPENPGGAYSNGIAEMLDVVGTNYRPNLLAELYKTHPQMTTIGTEDNFRALELQVMRDSPALSGEMLWTGIDYLGEGMGQAIGQGFGLFDRTNEPRLRAYERQAWWISAATKPMVKIGRTETLPNARLGERGGGEVMDWTPADTTREQTVLVQSNCEEVELFLNDKSLGKKTRPADWAPRTWKIPFEAGTLKAIASNAGKEAATDELHTAGKATHIKLTIDQPKLSPAWDDVAFVRAELVDDKGVVNPNDNGKVTFKIEGPGILAAVDNADLDSHEPFRGNERSAYRGKCAAIIKATGTSGKITITGSADGMEMGGVSVEGTTGGHPSNAFGQPRGFA